MASKVAFADKTVPQASGVGDEFDPLMWRYREG